MIMSMDGLPEYTPSKKAAYTFKIPAKLAKLTGINSVAVCELDGEDENMAYKRATTATESTFQLAKASLVEINGNRVSLGDGSTDREWNKLHPKIRTLVVRAYNDVNNPAQDDLEDFLSSREIVVG